MSHKTHYKTFSQPDLAELEREVNDYLRSLYKDDKIEDVKVGNITTLNVNNVFVAAVTYSYAKKKKTVIDAAAEIMPEQQA
jgi:hypothetical protein